jgi:hypothetical protein
MEFLTEPTLPAFLLQAIVLILPIPGSYLAYCWAQAPMQQQQQMQDMTNLGLAHLHRWEQTIQNRYQVRYYFTPLLLASIMLLVTFSLTHPYIIQTGIKVGLLEEVINVFGPDHGFPRAIPVGRFLFWGWMGAYVYAFILVYRRFRDYDLTPPVYIFVCNRFLLAFVVSSIVGVGLGAFSQSAGVSFDVNLATVSIVAFFIGFFPERGLAWVIMTAQQALKQQGRVTNEMTLSEIEGLSIWQQSRLQQDGIENVQNLATADIPALVITTPFSLSQIVDWVDQAILMVYASPTQFEALQNVATRCASDILVIARTDALDELAEASGLKPGELKVLCTVLQSALNMKTVAYFRWQWSMDPSVVQESAKLQPQVS